MLLIQAVNAYTALLALMEDEMPYDAAHAVMEIKRKLKPHAEFFVKEERKLVDQYAEKKENGEIVWTDRGTFRFADPKAGPEYDRKRMELCSVTVEETIQPVKIPVPKKIKPVQIEALEGIVEFTEG